MGSKLHAEAQVSDGPRDFNVTVSVMVKEHAGRRTKGIGSVTHHGDYN